MAINLRTDETDERVIASLATDLGLSKQQTILKAVHELAERRGHRARVLAASDEMARVWAEALEQLRLQ